MTMRRGARGSVGAAGVILIDPPLLPGEVEIDVSDLGSSAISGIMPMPASNPDIGMMTTCRGELHGVESRLRIERMIAAARARSRGRDGG